jgi:hypothetical protein
VWIWPETNELSKKKQLQDISSSGAPASALGRYLAVEFVEFSE